MTASLRKRPAERPVLSEDWCKAVSSAVVAGRHREYSVNRGVWFLGGAKREIGRDTSEGWRARGYPPSDEGPDFRRESEAHIRRCVVQGLYPDAVACEDQMLGTGVPQSD